MLIAPILRHGVSFAAAGALTWWFLFSVPAPELLVPAPAVSAPVIQVAHAAPVVEPPAAASSQPAAPEPQPEPQQKPQQEPEPEPEPEAADDGQAPPEEAGSREGQDDGELQEEPEDGTESKDPADEPPEPVDTLEELTEDRELLEAARKELDGEVKLGFSTRFIGAARDQLAIARAFGEQVVLIPRSALDDDDASASSYVLDLGRGNQVRKVPGRPDLSRFRQYRDLFGFEFSALPEPMRRLRTSVVRRDEIFLFAALIPAREWAVAVGRRREALDRIGRTEEEAERFTLRYVPVPDGRFDFSVEAIDFSDGSTWRASGLPRR